MLPGAVGLFHSSFTLIEVRKLPPRLGTVGLQACRSFLVGSRFIKLAKCSPSTRPPLRKHEVELSAIGCLHVPESASGCPIECRQGAFWLPGIEVKIPYFKQCQPRSHGESGSVLLSVNRRGDPPSPMVGVRQ